MKFKLLENDVAKTFPEVKKDNGLVNITEKGELVMKKAQSTYPPKGFLIVAYPKGKDFNAYPKIPIKVQKNLCEFEKLTVLEEKKALTYTLQSDKEKEIIPFETVKGWFKVERPKDSPVDPHCKLEPFNLVVVDEDPYIP